MDCIPSSYFLPIKPTFYALYFVLCTFVVIYHKKEDGAMLWFIEIRIIIEVVSRLLLLLLLLWIR